MTPVKTPQIALVKLCNGDGMKSDLMTDALPRSFTRFLRLAKISPMVAWNPARWKVQRLTRHPAKCFAYANRVANFVASGVASRVTTRLQALLKNFLIWWRYWLVGAASEPLRLRVAGEGRWPAYWALWLPRRAAW
jgi:hypothetical protein